VALDLPRETVKRTQLTSRGAGKQRYWLCNYFFGNDPSRWQTNVACFEEMRVQELSSGPRLFYSRLLGHTNELADPLSMAVDASGNSYVAGISAVTNDFGTSVPHVFVVKLDPTGAPVYGGVLVGTLGWGETPGHIAVDGQENVYLTGTTKSSDFPTFNALQPALRGLSDAFVVKNNSNGNAFVYSTYLGATRSNANSSSGDEVGFGIAVNSAGNAYVAGATKSGFFLRDLSATLLGHVQAGLNGPSESTFSYLVQAVFGPERDHRPSGSYSQNNWIGGGSPWTFPGANPSRSDRKLRRDEPEQIRSRCRRC
jgi:hypothetical protein